MFLKIKSINKNDMLGKYGLLGFLGEYDIQYFLNFV